MLKRLDHLGDQTIMDCWIEHSTIQYFRGSDFMKHHSPGDSSDWSQFRDRIGPTGMEKMFAYSVQWDPKEIKKSSSMVLSHTTVQGNNVMVSTDAKRNQIAKKEKIQQRQTDANPSKELVRQTFHGKPPGRYKKGFMYLVILLNFILNYFYGY